MEPNALELLRVQQIGGFHLLQLLLQTLHLGAIIDCARNFTFARSVPAQMPECDECVLEPLSLLQRLGMISWAPGRHLGLHSNNARQAKLFRAIHSIECTVSSAQRHREAQVSHLQVNFDDVVVLRILPTRKPAASATIPHSRSEYMIS